MKKAKIAKTDEQAKKPSRPTVSFKFTNSEKARLVAVAEVLDMDQTETVNYALELLANNKEAMQAIIQKRLNDALDRVSKLKNSS